MPSKSFIKYIIGIFIVSGVSYFFVREFYYNFDSISKFKFIINWFYLFASQLLLILVALVGIFLWQFLFIIITSKKISFKESLAIVSTSQLSKYLPGKVWSYAFQMVMLSKKGTSKTVVLYVNLFLVVSSLFASALLGLLYFVLVPSDQSQFWLLLLIVLLIIYSAFIFLNKPFLKLLVKIIQKLFNKTINYSDMEVRLIVLFQLVYLLANTAFGFTGYLLALGLGFSVSVQDIFAIAASLIIADFIGFIVLVAPGGLGIREGIMFAILATLGDKNLALILPLGTRIMSMISDLLLGGVGFFFLRKYYFSKNNRGNDVDAD